MKITKAIEILTHYCSSDARCYNPDLYDSVKLGIEALKELKLHRQFMHNSEFEPLLGEEPQ